MRSPSSYGNRGNVGGNNLGSNNLGNNRNGVGSNNRNGIGNNDRGNNSIGGNNRRNTNVNTGNRTVINNPTYAAGGAYGWNGGVAWAPAPYYYGGGFWGAMAIGVTSAAVYGAIVDEDEETHQETTYNSYQVQPNTPGASFLTSYGLTQVKCGPPNLVVVYGPENSVVCANPNGNVAAGNYDLNTENLSLTQR